MNYSLTRCPICADVWGNAFFGAFHSCAPQADLLATAIETLRWIHNGFGVLRDDQMANRAYGALVALGVEPPPDVMEGAG